MKKLILVMALAVVSFSANAQFNAGVNIGIPTGDLEPVTSFVYGAEVNYMYQVSDDFQVGPSLSFVNFSGKSVGGISFGDASFLPIAAAGRFSASESFTLGADIGYGIGVNSGNNGGFYYRPMVGYNVSDSIMVQLHYSGVSSNGATAANIGAGVMFAL